MGIKDRPYVGTWQLNNKRLVQHSPDALVYLNGDTALPGCHRCGGRLDFQQFITSVSVDCGVEPGGASANISLSIPRHFGGDIYADGQLVLRRGLEVHVYSKGYFPYRGLYEEAEVLGHEDLQVAPLAAVSSDQLEFDPATDMLGPGTKASGVTIPAHLMENATVSAGVMQVVKDYWSQGGTARLQLSSTGGYVPAKGSKHRKNSQHHQARAVDLRIYQNGRQLTQKEVYVGYLALIKAGKLPRGGLGFYGESTSAGKNVHYDWRGYHNSKHNSARWYYQDGQKLKSLQFDPNSVSVPDASGVRSLAEVLNPPVKQEPAPSDPAKLPQRQENVSPVDAYKDEIPVYPYYHVFHGVVTSVGQSESPGSYSVTLQCASMLHFWSFQNVMTNSGLKGNIPRGAKARTYLTGPKYTDTHPYSIMYDLYHREVGAPAGVMTLVNSPQSNLSATSSAVNDSLYHLQLEYWERRFSQKMYNLRMHGVSGELWSAAQQSQIARLSRSKLKELGEKTYKERINRTLDPFKYDKNQQRRRTSTSGQLLGGTSALFSNAQGLNAADQVAFAYDLGELGNVDLFEAQYSSKLDIATSVTEAAGYEFYQDVDGDLVFKPPFYNLDTSSSKVYVLEDVDLIEFSEDEQEPEATYMIVTGTRAHTQGKKGVGGTEGILRNMAIYVDWKLVAQYGWREATREVTHIWNKRALYLYAVNQLTEMNKTTRTASATIPHRPELRPGFPVYVRRVDAYFYCTAISHSIQFGSQCNTSLTLVAKRPKFHAPGHKNKKGIDAIDLGNMSLPNKPLEIIGPDGSPRLKGFPNVVMALDPQAMNPLWGAGGAEVLSPDNPNFLKDLVSRGRHLGILAPAWDQSTGGSDKERWEKGPWQFSSGNHTFKVTLSSLKKQKRHLHGAQGRGRTNRRGPTLGVGDEAVKAKAQKQAGALLALMEQVQDRLAADGDLPTPGSTAALLDLLYDRKANLNANNMPGSYRYYSCSHPNPAHQGQLEVVSTESGYKAGGRSLLDQPVSTTGFIRNPTRLPNGHMPEAQLGTVKVVAGLKVQQPVTSKKPIFRTLPTNQIMSTGFVKAVHSYTAGLPTEAEAQQTAASPASSLRDAIASALGKVIKGKQPKPTDTLASVLEKPYTKLAARMEAQAGGAHPAFGSTKLKVKGSEISSSTITFSQMAGTAPPAQKLKAAVAQYAALLEASQEATFKEMKDEGGATDQDISKRRTELVAVLNGTPTSTRKKARKRKKKPRQVNGTTIVLPVSDAEGYQHFGGYQYGRGLDIQAGGTYEQLVKQDPLQFADADDVHAMVKRLSQKDGKLSLKGGANDARYLKQAARIAAAAGTDLGLDFDHSPGTISNLSSAQKGQFDIAFRNWVANSFNSEHKVVAANAAVSLASLQQHMEGSTCQCQAADAALELQAFGAGTYVSVQGGPATAVDWVAEQMAREGDGWKKHQDGLRGTYSSPHAHDIGHRAHQTLTGVGQSAQTSLTAAQAAFRELFED